jgi:gas vesicle protein
VSEGNKSQSFLVGLVVGGVIGAALTLWLTGKVRHGLRDRGIDVGGRLGELGSLVREKGEDFLSRAKEVVEHTVEEGREARHRARSELEERLRKEREE